MPGRQQALVSRRPGRDTLRVYLRRVSEVQNGGLGMKRKWAPFKYQYSRQVTLDLNFPVVAPLRRLCANIRRSHAPTVALEDNAKRRSHCASMVGRNVKDTLAERLRRRPAKPMGSPRVGSNPTGVVLKIGVGESCRCMKGLKMLAKPTALRRRNARTICILVIFQTAA